MRVRETTSFPHPLLSPHTSDYKNGEFSLELDDVKETLPDGHVTLKGRIILKEPDLAWLRDKGSLCAGLMITCRDTYLDQWYKLEKDQFRLELKGGCVRGAVHVQAMIVAIEDVVLPDTGLVAGFTEYSRTIRAGSPVAISLEQQLETGFDKMVAMESIFSLSPDESVADNMFMVDTDSESIHIRAAVGLFEDIQRLRGTTSRNVLLSALYLPVMMEVLDVFRSGEFSDHRWHRIIRAKCNASGITLDENTENIAEIAQQLLHAPLGLLARTVEDLK